MSLLPGDTIRHLLRPFMHACCMQAGVAIQTVNAEGLMGSVATREFREGDTICSVPDKLAVALLSTEYTSAVSSSCCFFAGGGASMLLAAESPAVVSCVAPGHVFYV